MRRTRRPVVITDAVQSPADELRRRQNRYIVMMLARAGFLVLAAVLAMMRVPLLGVWVTICLIGAVVLPWLAVVLANDRAPRPKRQVANRVRPRPPQADPVRPALPQRTEAVIIDAEP